MLVMKNMKENLISGVNLHPFIICTSGKIMNASLNLQFVLSRKPVYQITCH